MTARCDNNDLFPSPLDREHAESGMGSFIVVVGGGGGCGGDELVSSSPTQRNWRGILIALLVILAVLALIVTSVVLLTPPDEGPRVRGTRFKLSQVLGQDFTPLRFNGTWISDWTRPPAFSFHLEVLLRFAIAAAAAALTTSSLLN
ncbi:hypothetical protein FOCC_FOCC017102 [Frankliniella occidentalis]|nr:hypothetical protein FOCC_FOCC017102 [Frankliniella occidentalis]